MEECVIVVASVRMGMAVALEWRRAFLLGTLGQTENHQPPLTPEIKKQHVEGMERGRGCAHLNEQRTGLWISVFPIQLKNVKRTGPESRLNANPCVFACIVFSQIHFSVLSLHFGSSLPLAIQIETRMAVL